MPGRIVPLSVVLRVALTWVRLVIASKFKLSLALEGVRGGETCIHKPEEVKSAHLGDIELIVPVTLLIYGIRIQRGIGIKSKLSKDRG